MQNFVGSCGSCITSQLSVCPQLEHTSVIRYSPLYLSDTLLRLESACCGLYRLRPAFQTGSVQRMGSSQAAPRGGLRWCRPLLSEGDFGALRRDIEETGVVCLPLSCMHRCRSSSSLPPWSSSTYRRTKGKMKRQSPPLAILTNPARLPPNRPFHPHCLLLWCRCLHSTLLLTQENRAAMSTVAPAAGDDVFRQGLFKGEVVFCTGGKSFV